MNTQSLPQNLIESLPKRVQALFSVKGQIVSLLIGREAKVRKGLEPIFKFSRINVRVGVNYDNIQAVKEKREDGTLPAENAGLAWGQYVPGLFPYLIEYKGQLYFRFTVVHNPHAVHEVKWVRNEKEISKEEAKEACLASEFQERETTLDTFTLKVESILQINGQDV